MLYIIIWEGQSNCQDTSVYAEKTVSERGKMRQEPSGMYFFVSL